MEVDFQRPPAEMLYDSYYRTNTRDAVKTALNAKACHCAALAGEQRRLRPLTHPLVKDACADFEVLSHRSGSGFSMPTRLSVWALKSGGVSFSGHGFQCHLFLYFSGPRF